MPAPEARLESGQATGPGWFVLNLSESSAGRSERVGTWTEFEPPGGFEQYGVNVHVVMPGQANCRYHEESNQEDFLVLHGECVLVVEDQERRLRQWDFVHCPPGTRHVFVGAGDGPCAILMIGSRAPDDRIEYPVSEVAARHDASVAETTDTGREAYRGFPPQTHGERFSWPLGPAPEARG
jgi:uncharacterized cupin superfamily protein